MKILYTYILLLFIQLFTFFAAAEEANDIQFTHINLSDGLSNSTVFNIAQDQDGYLWFVTSDGLNKYDGYHFKVYRHIHGNTTSIASNGNKCISIDAQDRVWIGTTESLSLYDRDKDNFTNFFYKKRKKNTAIDGIVPINKDSLLLCTTEGMLLFNISERRFSNDGIPAPMSLWRNAIATRNGDEVYIGANNALYTYSILTGTLEKLIDLPKVVRVQALLTHQMHHRIWIATEGSGLFAYDLKTKKMHHFKKETGELNSNYVRSLALDPNNNLWIGTYEGLNIYKENNGKFISLKSVANKSGSLSQNSVRCIFKDSQQGMWLGTYWGGLNYYHPLCNRFKHICYSSTENSLSNNLVSCIVVDKHDNLWIGTSDGGLNYYNQKTQHFKNYLFEAKNTDLELAFRDIKTIYVDKLNDKVYIGTHATGMMIVDKKNERTTYLNTKNSNLPTNNIYSIIPDKSEGLWIAALNYLLRYDFKKNKFSVIQHLKNDRTVNSFRMLFNDSQNNIWIGGENGLMVYKKIDRTLVPNKDYKIPYMLEEASIKCFFESSTGVLWIGTSNGLFALSIKSGECTKYTIDNGLPSDAIYGILEDVYGRLWISTNQGLTCMTPDAKFIRNFTIVDGLQSNQFYAGSFCRSKSGRMYFGGINGISAFDPETLIDNSFTPKPIINKLQVFNKEVIPGDETGILKKSIEKLSSITLKPDQNSFTLSFVVMNYIARKHNTFAYKLEGYDNTWYKQNDIQPVSYSNLPAGDYTFYIKAANNDGKWNVDPTLLKITILPLWYHTWWAYLLYLLTFSLVVIAIFRFFWIRKNMRSQIEMERREKERQEEISQMKIRFYIDISHELRTPLTLIAAPIQELLHRITGHWEREQLQYIERNTNRLLHLVNQLMDYRRAELGIFKLQPTITNAYKRVLNIFINYDNLSKKKDIDYNFYSEVQEKNYIIDENYLDLIANNLLSNAFKYTDKGKSITVRLYEEKEYLVLQISDTGVGIPEKKQKKIFERFYQVDSNKAGSGIGLSLVERLVSLHHGKIDLKSKENQGTTFTVYIPQDKSLYTPEELEHTNNMLDEKQMYYTNARDSYVDDDITDVAIEDEDNELISDNEKKNNILVVEDNNELRQYLVSGLSGQFNVLQVTNGQEAIDFLKNEENEVDLILTDVMMPVMDGIKLCRLLKQNIRTCHIPVYMLSAKTDLRYQMEGFQVGADDYIAKPFSLTVLKAKIQNTLRTRGRAFERYSNTTEIEPEKIANNSMDEELLRRAIEVVEKNMDNVEFSTEMFAHEMNMSRSNLHLKLKAITGKSAIDFIHKIRFNRACQLLKEGKYTISEISFMVGYNTPSYFTARFKKYMGCLPTEYVKK